MAKYITRHFWKSSLVFLHFFNITAAHTITVSLSRNVATHYVQYENRCICQKSWLRSFNHHLPDTVLGKDSHYCCFPEVYSKFYLCLKSINQASMEEKKWKTHSFSGSMQHVKNVDVMVMCDEKWWLFYAPKVSSSELNGLLCSLHYIMLLTPVALRYKIWNYCIRRIFNESYNWAH